MSPGAEGWTRVATGTLVVFPLLPRHDGQQGRQASLVAVCGWATAGDARALVPTLAVENPGNAAK